MKKKILFATHEDLGKTAVARSMFLDVASSLSDEYDCTVLSAGNIQKEIRISGLDHLHFERRNPGAVSLRDAWSMAKYIFRNRRVLADFDIYYVRSYPAMILLATIGRRLSTPIIFDTRGLFFHELLDSKKIKSKNFLPALIRLEKWLLRSAKAVICVSEAQMRYYLTLEPNKKKYHIIYNSAPAPKIPPVAAETSPLTIAYVGSMGIWHLPQQINLIVNQLRKSVPDLKFHCITPDIDQAKSLFSSHPNTLIYSHSFRYAPKRFDFAFCLIKDSFSKKVCFPVKLCEYLAAQTPVVFSDNVDVCNSLNDKYNFGVPISLLPPPEVVADELIELLPAIKKMTATLPDELNFESLIQKVVTVIKSM